MYLILILIYICSISRFIDLTFLGVSKSSEWWTYITYNFIHLSFLHLAINSIAFYSYWRIVKRFFPLYVIIPILLCVSAISAFFCSSDTPTIGLSSIVYSLLGIYIPLMLYKKDRYKTYALVLVSFIVSMCFITKINTPIHIMSFLLSLIPGYIRRYYADK